MLQPSTDFLNLFVRPPGDLIYFLIAVALSQAGLLIALGERLRRPDNRAAGRYTVAALGIVLAWVALMIGALYAVLSNMSATAILPPLERAVNVIVILLVGWAFLTADHDRWGRLPNIILLILLLVVASGYVFTGSEWPNLVDQTDFNLSTLGAAWLVIPALLSLLGLVLILLYFRLVTDAPLKLVFFSVLLLGYGGTLLQLVQGNLFGNDTGLARLAFVAALSILPAVIHRMVINSLETELSIQSSGFFPPAPSENTPPPTPVEPPAEAPATSILPTVSPAPLLSPIQRDSVQLLKTLGLILEEANPADIPERIIRAALEVLRGEVGAILTLQDANYADVIAAYNKVKEHSLSGISLNLDQQPTLVNTIERRLQRPLYPDRNVEELHDLYSRLDIEHTGPTYFQPLISGKDLVAILLVGTPYEERELQETERELLKGIGLIAGGLLALSFAARDARLKAEERTIQALIQGVPLNEIEEGDILAARQEMQTNLQLAREQVRELSSQVMELKLELDRERTRVSSSLGDTEEGLSVSQRILVLNDEQQRLRDERDQLAARLQEAEATLAGATATGDETILRTMIEVLRREKDDLATQRDALQAQIADLRASDPVLPQVVQDIIENMGQEKARLEIERDQIGNKLADIETQLRALGIQGGSTGIAQLIAQLTEQRATLQVKNEALALERDALLNERRQLEERIQQEKEREARIQALQSEIKNLASDREAATKQRDQFRTERDELIGKLDTYKQQRARLVAEASGYQVELAEAHQEQAKLRAQFQQITDERSELVSARDRLLAENQALATERDQLLARLEGNRERLQQLNADGVGSLTRMIEDLTTQREQLEHELNETRTTLAATQNRLDMLQVHANAEEEPVTSGFNPDLILGMVQELRTPMTSIVGYIDLLLDESAGILGEMQRKFLQRVASNVTRLELMLEDFTRITALDTGKFSLLPQPIDVVGLVEDAITNSMHQFREKGLIVDLVLDDNVPKIRADRDGISQIIGELLNNAYLASPQNSRVLVTAHRQEVKLSQSENFVMPTDSLLISIEDRGGGIPSEDISRVFARKYKAENPLIQGLGDTGVGLSIAKTLAEAHGGSLWFESRPGMGSIFYFALPINTTPTSAVKG